MFTAKVNRSNARIAVGLLIQDQKTCLNNSFNSALMEACDGDFVDDSDPLMTPKSLCPTKVAKLTKKYSSQCPQEPTVKENDDSKSPLGIFIAAISSTFFATSALIVKTSNVRPMELIALRGLVQGVLVIPFVVSSKSNFCPKGSILLLLTRGLLGAFALVTAFASIQMISLADAATLIFSSPVFISIFACVFLGEPCTWFDSAIIGLTLVGVVLVSKPSFYHTTSWTAATVAGTMFGLTSAVLTALAFMTVRKLKHVHYSVTVCWYSFTVAITGVVLTLVFDGIPTGLDTRNFMECVGVGICGFCGQTLLTKALQLEKAGSVAVARTMDIVLAFVYQIVLLHDSPDWKSYLGSALVVLCVVLVAFRR